MSNEEILETLKPTASATISGPRSRVEYYTDKAGEYRWRIVAKNGVIIGASSEGFNSMSHAKKNLMLIILAVQEIAVSHWTML